MNIFELLESRQSKTPHKPFLISESDDRQFTYLEFKEAVLRTASMLIALGIKRGNTVSLLLPNSAEYLIAYFACWRIGAIAGPVNSLLKADELTWILIRPIRRRTRSKMKDLL